MVERAIKTATSGWRPWALGAAALSMLGAVAALYAWTRRTSTEEDEVYEAWWRHRDKVRGNGSHPPDSYRSGGSQLFV